MESKLSTTIEHSNQDYNVVVSQLCKDAIANGEHPDMMFACWCEFEDLTKTEWEMELPNNCDGDVSSYQHHLIAEKKFAKDGEDALEALGGDVVMQGHFLTAISIDVDCSCTEVKTCLDAKNGENAVFAGYVVMQEHSFSIIIFYILSADAKVQMHRLKNIFSIC